MIYEPCYDDRLDPYLVPLEKSGALGRSATSFLFPPRTLLRSASARLITSRNSSVHRIRWQRCTSLFLLLIEWQQHTFVSNCAEGHAKEHAAAPRAFAQDPSCAEGSARISAHTQRIGRPEKRGRCKIRRPSRYAFTPRKSSARQQSSSEPERPRDVIGSSVQVRRTFHARHAGSRERPRPAFQVGARQTCSEGHSALRLDAANTHRAPTLI